MAWRDLFSGLTGGRRAKDQEADHDPFTRPEVVEASEPDGLALALDQIEAAALEVYAANDLPDQPGHYRRAPNETEWRFLGAHLAPEARFALALEHPPEQGWRFARLQDLGARSDRADVGGGGGGGGGGGRAPPRLLNDVAEFRLARRGVLTQDHLLMAMELGGAWRTLQDARAIRTSQLNLSVPRKPRARRDKPVSEA